MECYTSIGVKQSSRLDALRAMEGFRDRGEDGQIVLPSDNAESDDS